ncbi:hypothetical protein EBT31_01185 [bacterium]|nr:hypothetical protein [bacterium]
MSKYLVFVMSVLTIASTAIGIQCIGDDKAKASNKKFLVYMLIAAILALLGSGFMIYRSMRGNPGKVVVETTTTNVARGNVNAAPAGLKQS